MEEVCPLTLCWCWVQRGCSRLDGVDQLIPVPDTDTQTYWEGCKRSELLIQRCLSCEKLYFYPRMLCPHCMGRKYEWVKVSGRGVVYSYTLIRRPPVSGLEVPYILAIVELEEGVRMMSNIIDCKEDEIDIGMKVEVIFQPVSDEIYLPKFRPVKG
ncbi:MAG: Zn-ribbon domain-containing OB-fold protein [Clostridia bacterium]|nr:MAG: Zn-ribbon domain-containing OB-fold protein [Clostridia bacterium]